jgi:hypothetical protein
MMRGFVVVGLAGVLLASACSGSSVSPTSDDLRKRFPDRAPQILDDGDELIETRGGFANGTTRGSLNVLLPATGDGPVRLTDARGFEVRVFEEGLRGAATRAATAITYSGEHRTSFWTASQQGLEEWLLLEKGATERDGRLAAWRVEGARVKARGHVAEFLDANGTTRFAAAAPSGFSASGRRVELEFRARNDRIELFAKSPVDDVVLVDPLWTTTPPMFDARYLHTANGLSNGKILVAGGYAGLTSTSHAELYDPQLNSWTAAASMTGARGAHVSATLANGKVLVAGGFFGGHIKSAELYDPTTNTWSPAGAMASPRNYFAAATLMSGKVLITGGYNGSIEYSSAELYDPAANSWSAAGSMNTARSGHTLTLLSNGKVLVVGGASGPAELYDPVSGSFSPTSAPKVGHTSHAATLLPSGKVLVSGSGTGAEIYDPVANTWTLVPSMAYSRADHTSTLLVDGSVLVVGGWGGVSQLASERFDVTLGQWLPAAPLTIGRHQHAAAGLTDGRVLVMGGLSNGVTQNTAEVYDPTGAPLGTPCSSPQQCASYSCIDGVCCETACAGGVCHACSVAAGSTQNGSCTPLTGSSCNDQDPCTNADTCSAGTCAGTPATGDACDDGDGCTQTDTCVSGTCTGSNPVVCTAADACHVAGTCDSTTGTCSNPTEPNGTACDDANACTGSSHCTNGTCVGANSVVCPFPEACHWFGTCDPSSGVCSTPELADGTVCDDGNPCTEGDTCVAGGCQGQPRVCSPNDCNDMVCNPFTGDCDPTPKPDHTSCDDGQPCTGPDECKAGYCAGPPSVTCEAPDDCHFPGSCDESGTCVSTVKSDGATCDDGDPCTESDECTAGVCGGKPMAQCGPPPGCDSGKCDDPPSPAPDGSEGCSCRSVASSSELPSAWWLGVALLLWQRRRYSSTSPSSLTI